MEENRIINGNEDINQKTSKKADKKFTFERVSSILFFCVLCFVLALQSFEIKTLQDNISYLDDKIDEISNSVDGIYSEVYDSVYSSVSEALTEQNSIITKATYEYGELKDDNRTGQIIFSVIPKNVTEHMQVTLQIDDDIIVPTKRKKGNVFEGVYEQDIFKSKSHKIHSDAMEPCTFSVTVTDETGSNTEFVEDWQMDLTYMYSAYLPTTDIYADYGVAYGEGICNVDITLDVTGEATEIQLITEINGKVVDTNTEKVKKSKVKFNKEYDIAFGDKIGVYAVIEDELRGYTYKYTVLYEKAIEGNNGGAGGDIYADIYDKNGKLLSMEY